MPVVSFLRSALPSERFSGLQFALHFGAAPRCAFMVIISLLSRPVLSSSLNQESGLDRQSAKIVAKLLEARQKIEETDVAKRKILGTIYTIQQRMKKISHEKNNLTDELYHVQGNVKGVAKVIAVLEKEIDAQRHVLRHRLAALYKLSGEGYIAILFSQASPLDLDEALRNLKTVTQKDYALIRSYQENVQLYKSQRKKLKFQVEHLFSLESQIKKQEGLLAEEHRQKSQIVSELDRSRTVHLSKIRTIRSDTQKSESVASSESAAALTELLKPSIFEQKGQLSSPVTGRIVQEFGMIVDERYKTQLSHKGWLFSAIKGAPVSSVFAGTVAFASWIKGYGKVILIDHGDHYYTVYAHITRFKVKSGDTINRGQVIAEVRQDFGVTSDGSLRLRELSRDDAGLYFEIRHFSEPENPVHWISAHGVKMALADSALEKISTGNDQKLKQAGDVAIARPSGTAILEDHQ